MKERRRAERHPIAPLAAAIQVCSAERRERGAVIRDFSETGLLFVSRTRFAVGERVVVKFDEREGCGTGRVVRQSLDDQDGTLFHHLTAIELDAPATASYAAG
jgi:hypothetical protein